MEIGNKLRSRRTELGLSRIELAEQIHVTASSIANYENGISYPKPDTLIALILALKIDANYLYQDYLTSNKISEYFGHELSHDEQEALFKYRRLSESGKQNVRQTIDKEYSKSTSKDWVEFPCAFPGMRRINLTGDGPKSILVAPLWSGNKKAVLNYMNKRFNELNVIQGSLCS